jgi:hypothetical protein
MDLCTVATTVTVTVTVTSEYLHIHWEFCMQTALLVIPYIMYTVYTGFELFDNFEFLVRQKWTGGGGGGRGEENMCEIYGDSRIR